jgi:hypothetical protein
MYIRIAAAVVLGAVVLGASAPAQDRGFAPRRVSASELKIPVPQAALDQQFQALKAMPSIEVEYSRLGNISRLQGQTHLFISATGRSVAFDQPADEIIQKLRTVLVARGTEKLITRSSYQHPDGKLLSLKLGQTIRGLSVEGTHVQLEIDTETGEIVSGSFLFVPDHGLPTEPLIAAEEAFRVATEAVQETHKAAKGTVTQPRAPVLKYQRPYRRGDVPRMIWEVYAAYPAQGVDGGTVIVVIDAVTGELRDMRTASVHAVNWPAWTAFNARPSSTSFPDGLGSTTETRSGREVSSACERNRERPR